MNFDSCVKTRGCCHKKSGGRLELIGVVKQNLACICACFALSVKNIICTKIQKNVIIH